jgi:hypothetical protein
METSEKKGLLCPRDRHVAQAPQGTIITGAFHTVFPRKRGKQRQRLREESMLKEACHARDECGGFPQRKGNPRFCSPRTLCSAAGITHGCRSHIDVGTLRHAAPGCPVICVSRLTGQRHSGIRVFSHAPPTPEGSPHASIAEPCLLVQ